MENQIFMGVLQWDAVDFNKNKVLNICILIFATGINRYLIFRDLAHVAFWKQTLHIFPYFNRHYEYSFVYMLDE